MSGASNAAKCAAIASRYTPRWSFLVSEAWKSSVEELESQELASLQKNSLGNHPLHSSTGRNLDWHPHPGYPGFPHSCHTSTRHGHIPQWKGGLSSWLSSSATLQETGQGLCSSCLSAVVFHHKFVAGWKMSHEILESQSFEIQSASIATFLWTKKSQLLHLNLDSQVEPLERCFQWGSSTCASSYLKKSQKLILSCTVHENSMAECIWRNPSERILVHDLQQAGFHESQDPPWAGFPHDLP